MTGSYDRIATDGMMRSGTKATGVGKPGSTATHWKSSELREPEELAGEGLGTAHK